MYQTFNIFVQNYLTFVQKCLIFLNMNNLYFEIDTKTEMPTDFIIQKVCKFMNMDRPFLFSKTIDETIKEICVAKLCKVLGIKCIYNYKNEFFSNFSMLVGEAVVRLLDIKITIAPCYLSCVKFDGINFIETVSEILQSTNIEKGIYDAFNFINKHKHLIPNYKKV